MNKERKIRIYPESGEKGKQRERNKEGEREKCRETERERTAQWQATLFPTVNAAYA